MAPAAFAAPLPTVVAIPPPGGNDLDTTTLIKHVIVIYGENCSFDHLFVTYCPHHGETVRNALSEGIIDELGRPGPNFEKAAQYQASDITTFSIAPSKTGPYVTLPPPQTGGAPTSASDTDPPTFATVAASASVEYGLLPCDIPELTTGATGLSQGDIDTSVINYNGLPGGPFQLTPGLPYVAYTTSPVHRFYQNWQQDDCAAVHTTADNPNICLHDLFPWVKVTIGRHQRQGVADRLQQPEHGRRLDRDGLL